MTNRTTAELREAIEALLSVMDYGDEDPDFADDEAVSYRADKDGNPIDDPMTFGHIRRVRAALALLPQPPALGGIVEEIDGLLIELEATKEAAEAIPGLGATNEIRDVESALNAALVNAWPTLRANLKQEEWIEGHPPEQPEDTAWMVHRDEWRSAKITHFNRDAWYIDGNRYAPHYRFDRYCKPLPTPPQSKKEG